MGFIEVLFKLIIKERFSMNISVVKDDPESDGLSVIKIGYTDEEVNLFGFNDNFCEMYLNGVLVDFVKFIPAVGGKIAVFYQVPVKNIKYGTLKEVEFKSGDFDLIFNVNFTFFEKIERKIEKKSEAAP